MEEQEVTMEGMVINDLAQQVAAAAVDRAAWRARAIKAEEQLAAIAADEDDEGTEEPE